MHVRLNQLRKLMHARGFREGKFKGGIVFSRTNPKFVHALPPIDGDGLVPPIHLRILRTLLDAKGIMDGEAFDRWGGQQSDMAPSETLKTRPRVAKMHA